MKGGKWPKKLLPLTPEQQRVSDDFVKHWHEVLPRKYGIIERFNHGYIVKRSPKDFVKTLEIGAGLGEHLAYEKLSESQMRNYMALELRENMAEQIKKRYPGVKVIVGDCQERLDFPDNYFDRILAVHVLEHLPNLPAAVREIHRLSDKRRGKFYTVIPCEGSMPYAITRRFSARRMFERRYGQSYRWFIEREHINKPDEIFEELKPCFEITHKSFFPIPLPFVSCNLCVGLTLRPRV